MVESKPKKNTNWMLWWKIDKEDLDNQISNYNSLSIIKSYRGQSALLLLLSFVITVIFILVKLITPLSMLDALLFLILAYFIYKGKKWAILAAMLLWTFEKGLSLYDIFQGQATTSPITPILWWVAYMAVFYKAYQVEKMRNSTS